MSMLSKQGWVAVGAAAAFSVFGLGATALVWRTQEQIVVESEAVEGLRDEIAVLAAEVALYDELMERLVALRHDVETYVQILPAPEVATHEFLMRRVSEHCAYAGVAVSSFKQVRAKGARRPRGVKRKAAFTEVRLQLAVAGTNAQLLRLINRLERERSLIRVNSFSYAVPGDALLYDGVEVMRLKLDLSTFRYEAG